MATTDKKITAQKQDEGSDEQDQKGINYTFMLKTNVKCYFIKKNYFR